MVFGCITACVIHPFLCHSERSEESALRRQTVALAEILRCAQNDKLYLALPVRTRVRIRYRVYEHVYLVPAEVSIREQLTSVDTLAVWVKRGMGILPMNHGRDQSSPRLRRGRPPVPRFGNCCF